MMTTTLTRYDAPSKPAPVAGSISHLMIAGARLPKQRR